MDVLITSEGEEKKWCVSTAGGEKRELESVQSLHKRSMQCNEMHVYACECGEKA